MQLKFARANERLGQEERLRSEYTYAIKERRRQEYAHATADSAAIGRSSRSGIERANPVGGARFGPRPAHHAGVPVREASATLISADTKSEIVAPAVALLAFNDHRAQGGRAHPTGAWSTRRAPELSVFNKRCSHQHRQ